MGKNYIQAFKSTTIFGGVQIFTIIIGLLKNKLIAYYLGVEGYGINSIFNSTINMIRLTSSLGIDLSGVKEISEANQKNDDLLLDKTISTVRFWGWVTGLIGSVILISMSPLISQWTFNSDKYTLAYIILSPTILFLSIYSAEMTILRGVRYIKEIANASVLGGFIGVVMAIPLFYWFKNDGIIPLIIASSFLSFVLMKYFSKKLVIKSSYYNSLETYYKNGGKLIKLGFLMSLGNIVGLLTSYLVIIVISNYGGVSDVGLYNAGWSITNQYIGLVFAAMAADYLPRLSAVNNDNLKMRECVNDQVEIASLIIGPILCLLLILAPFIVKILLSTEFLSTTLFIRILAFGIFFQASSWALGYVLIAKGNGQKYLTTQITASGIKLPLIAGFYLIWGLTGLGIGYILSQISYLIYSWSVVYTNYEFTFERKLILFSLEQLLYLLLLMLTIIFLQEYIYISAFIEALLLVMSIRSSFIKLNNNILISKIIKKLIQKK